MVELVTIDLALDLILKVILVAVLVYLAVLLRIVDRILRSFEKSAHSIEHTAGTVDDVASILTKIPFVGRKRRRTRKREVDVE